MGKNPARGENGWGVGLPKKFFSKSHEIQSPRTYPMQLNATNGCIGHTHTH